MTRKQSKKRSMIKTVVHTFSFITAQTTKCEVEKAADWIHVAEVFILSHLPHLYSHLNISQESDLAPIALHSWKSIQVLNDPDIKRWEDYKAHWSTDRGAPGVQASVGSGGPQQAGAGRLSSAAAGTNESRRGGQREAAQGAQPAAGQRQQDEPATATTQRQRDPTGL